MTTSTTTPKESTMTTTLYKAISPAGTDFHTGRTDYAGPFSRGETVKHPRPHNRDASGYISVTDSPMDIPGARWPLVLWEIEFVGESWKPGDGFEHKHAAYEIRGIREVPSHLCFGPQGERIAEIIDAYWAMDGDDHAAMRALRGDYDTWWRTVDRAWDAAGSLGVVSYPAGFGLGLGGDYWSAGLCGALALLVRSLDPSKISAADYELLSRPWREYVGPVHADDTLPAKGKPAQ